MKLIDSERKRAMTKESETPRTDRFVQEVLRPMRLHRENFASDAALLAMDGQIRELMIAWAEHARTLEREVNASVPQEWHHTHYARRDE